MYLSPCTPRLPYTLVTGHVRERCGGLLAIRSPVLHETSFSGGYSELGTANEIVFEPLTGLFGNDRLTDNGQTPKPYNEKTNEFQLATYVVCPNQQKD